MKMAYADPPYLGKAKIFYGKLHEKAGDYDDIGAHRELIIRLCDEFPDGWALSASSTSLRQIMSIVPFTARMMVWVKPFASFKPNVNPAYAWEPVFVNGGRPRTRQQETVRDWVSANITLQTGTPGAKPPEFCRWLFEVLNLEPGDSLTDMFPGSGNVERAWQLYRKNMKLPFIQSPERAGEKEETQGEMDGAFY